MSFHIFNTDCNAGQGQFRSMQQSWKKYRGGNYNVQRVGAAALREDSEKAGEKPKGDMITIYKITQVICRTAFPQLFATPQLGGIW